MLKRVLITGGDERAARMAPMLEAEGFEVHTLGLFQGDERGLQTGWAHALLFPYPRSVAGGLVPTLTGLTLRPEDALACAAPGAVALHGAGLEKHLLAAGEGLRWTAYSHDERFLTMNAELSAEAAVYEAMGMTDEALMGMTMLVTGYGRFARALALRLKALGATVWVAARRQAQRLAAASDGMRAADFSELADVLPRVSMALNTVPAPVLDNEQLSLMKPGACLLELASAPYGFDRARAEAAGLKTALLPGLPARYAPQSAARALKQACVRLMLEAAP